MKIKIFKNSYLDKIESELNEFLINNKYIDLKLLETERFYIVFLMYE